MATDFRFAGSTFASVTDDANNLQDVQITTFVATPSNVAFQVVAPIGDNLVAETAQQASELAALYNSAAQTPGVAALATGEAPTLAGEPQQVVYITVSSASGKSATQVTVPQAQLANTGIAAEVTAARTLLDALEAL